MPVKIEFYCDACGNRIYGGPTYSRNTAKHGQQVVCSERCRDTLLARDASEERHGL
jgi:hypothetical protein